MMKHSFIDQFFVIEANSSDIDEFYIRKLRNDPQMTTHNLFRDPFSTVVSLLKDQSSSREG